MKTFVKDYVGLCKESNAFYRKHWKGAIVMNVVSLGLTAAYLYKDNIKDFVKSKKNDEESA